GLAHFAAEVQIVLGALAVWWWAAAGMLLAVLLTTAMFVWTLQRVLMGKPDRWKGLKHLSAREGVTVAALLVLLVVLGIFPGPLSGLIEGAAEQVRAAVLTRR
ncbi:MAG TPA: hypothetical protein VLQ93_08545, partial [Myxococcaceae bacterium]|nr:hypothetical protein [Myxococcaceae bacterium]